MLVPPVLVTVSESVLLLLTCTLPKARLVGFDATAPAVMPVPVKGTFNVGFEAFEVMATLPLTAPAADGANTTLKVALWPRSEERRVGKERRSRWSPHPST